MQLCQMFCNLWVKVTPVLLFQGEEEDVIIPNISKNYCQAAVQL